jgi:hypothetical protein
MAARLAASRLSLARQVRELGPWHLVAMVAAAGVLLAAPRLAWHAFNLALDTSDGSVWQTLVEATRRLPHGTLNLDGAVYRFAWSPYAALLLTAVVPIGLAAWRIGHLALLPLTRDWRIVGLALLGYPFWLDVERGSLMTLVAVAGVGALRGGRTWTWVYLGLFILIPHPVMLPLAAWLLWHRPHLRLNFVAVLLAHLSTLGLLGLLVPWLNALLGAAAAGVADPLNLAPSRWIGAWWTPIGVPIAMLLTWRGYLGWASLAMSPYLLPYHALMLLLEFVRPADQRATQMTAVASA